MFVRIPFFVANGHILNNKNRGWILGAQAVALIVSIPLLTILCTLFKPTGDIWQHIATTVLKEYTINSLLLMISVAILTAIIGITTAWLTTMCMFPGKRYFHWLLLLPLSMPAYIIAFTYTGLLEGAGPLQTFIRSWSGWSFGDYWFPDIRSLPGAILILSLVLYPYVFMLVRAALLEQSVCVLEVSRTLGCGPWRCLFRVAIPLARPAIVVGLSLVCMETLADYGTVHYFGISTFTTGIFRTWFGLGNINAAAQLAAVLLGFIFVLIVIERSSRQNRRFHHTSSKYLNIPCYKLQGIRAFIAFGICFTPFFFGFLLPVTQLLNWTLKTHEQILNRDFLNLIWNSLYLAGMTAIIAILLAAFLNYAQRICPSRFTQLPVRVASMGYAVPGVIIAVGVIIPFGIFDNALDTFFMEYLEISTGLLLSGTLAILIFAYLVRFLSISIQTLEAGLTKIKPNMDNAAQTLGAKPLEILTKIHLPLMRSSLLTAGLLVFVDVLKELPATLVLRPFNFNTLAVRAYELASNEQLADAASAAIAIIIAGLIPVILLSRSINHSRPGYRAKQSQAST